MTEATIAAGFARAFLDFAVSRGGDRQMLIERSQLHPNALEEQDNRVPLANYIALMKAGIDLCNERALALLFGEAVRLTDISILGLIGQAETAEDARRQANRYARLAVDDGHSETSDRLEFIRENGNVWLNFADAVYRDNPLLTESALARCVCDGRAFAAAHGNTDACWPSPKAIHFTYEEPSYRAEYDRIFGVPVIFSSHMNAMLFDEELLSRRLPQTNPYVFRLLTRQAEALLERLENSKSTRGRVERLLIPILQTGEATIVTIAGQLQLSRQTLFRKLKAEGVTFEQVLDELRHKLALQYLNERKAVNETAYLVGFSDPAAFSRAFKRWTGSSPRTMRASKGQQYGQVGDANCW